MIIWLDAQLSRRLASWIEARFAIQCFALLDLNLHTAGDGVIRQRAREAGAVIMTKDTDFVDLLRSLGAPPQVLWVTCGNTSNARLRGILELTLPGALQLLEDGQPLVEITNAVGR